MTQFLLICLGGAAGTGARYLLAGWALRTLGTGFPYGTYAVNLIGSFLIGGLMHLGMAGALSPTVRIALTTGVLGGFTTYSTFNYETLGYFEEGAWALGALNVAATLLGCLAAGALGLWMARAFTGPLAR